VEGTSSTRPRTAGVGSRRRVCVFPVLICLSSLQIRGFTSRGKNRFTAANHRDTAATGMTRRTFGLFRVFGQRTQRDEERSGRRSVGWSAICKRSPTLTLRSLSRRFVGGKFEQITRPHRQFAIAIGCVTDPQVACFPRCRRDDSDNSDGSVGASPCGITTFSSATFRFGCERCNADVFFTASPNRDPTRWRNRRD